MRVHRAKIPGASGDLMRWHVIEQCLGLSDSRRFLEIGVQYGHVVDRVGANHKTGVDPDPRRNAEVKYHAFHRGPSDEFFENLDRDTRYDVVLVDGLHHADQVLRDVEHSLRHLADGGTIVMHDCNPATEMAQRVPRQSGVWNGDCWKAMVALRQRSDVDAFTIDADHGIGVVRKRPNPKPLTGIPQNLEYEHLVRNREEFLGLVKPAYWGERFGAPFAVGRVVVLTAIFGDRDEPIEAPANDAEYIMVTDGPGAPGWTIHREPASGDPRKAARRIKTLGLDLFPCDVLVWVDGRIRVQKLPLRPFLRQAMDGYDIAGYPHPWRRTLASEAEECAKLGLALPAAANAQVEAYRAAGFPDTSGLWNTMVLARRGTDQMRELGRAWWAELERHTLRDQISLPFLLWERGITCGRLGNDVYTSGSSEHFERGRHRRAAA